MYSRIYNLDSNTNTDTMHYNKTNVNPCIRKIHRNIQVPRMSKLDHRPTTLITSDLADDDDTFNLCAVSTPNTIAV